MATLRNISPLGDLDIDGVGLVEAGDTFEVDDDRAERLLWQAENFEAVTAPPPIPDAPAADTTPDASTEG